MLQTLPHSSALSIPEPVAVEVETETVAIETQNGLKSALVQERSPCKVTLSMVALLAASVGVFAIATWPIAVGLNLAVWGTLLVLEFGGRRPTFADVGSQAAANINAISSEVPRQMVKDTFSPPPTDPFHEEKMARQALRTEGPIELPQAEAPLRLVREELFGAPPASAPLPPPHPVSLSTILLPEPALTDAGDHHIAYRGAEEDEWKAYAKLSA